MKLYRLPSVLIASVFFLSYSWLYSYYTQTFKNQTPLVFEISVNFGPVGSRYTQKGTAAEGKTIEIKNRRGTQGNCINYIEVLLVGTNDSIRIKTSPLFHINFCGNNTFKIAYSGTKEKPYVLNFIAETSMSPGFFKLGQEDSLPDSWKHIIKGKIDSGELLAQ